MNPQTTTESRMSPNPIRQAGGPMNPAEDLATYFKRYASERPDVTALWCFGIGFVLGWKLKPW